MGPYRDGEPWCLRTGLQLLYFDELIKKKTCILFIKIANLAGSYVFLVSCPNVA